MLFKSFIKKLRKLIKITLSYVSYESLNYHVIFKFFKNSFITPIIFLNLLLIFFI